MEFRKSKKDKEDSSVKCDCGAIHTSFPNEHYKWCSVLNPEPKKPKDLNLHSVADLWDEIDDWEEILL